MPGKKQDVITLKVDRSLAEAMEGVANRSGFIRDAILTALENVCPLCMGTGILSPRQKQHWSSFARDHRMRQCPDCHERHLTCEHDKARPRRSGAHGQTPSPKEGKRP